MNRGYVKLWRKALDAGWIKNHKLWAFWSWCLMKASHKEYDAIVGLQVIHLIPGQFIFGRTKSAKETGLTEREIRTIIAFLIKYGNLTIKTTNKFSIITIVNWSIYQGEAIENDQLNDQPPTSNCPHTKTITHKQNTFTIPSIEEIKNYCTERKNKIDPQYFLDYETARDWKLKGGQKIRDWKAVIRTWEKNNFQTNSKTEQATSTW